MVTFVDHTGDVLSCSFSADNRQIASGGRDKKIKIWNTKGECKFTDETEHQDWVSAVRFSPDTKKPLLATGSWDGTIKVWDPNSMELQNTFVGHTNAVTTLAFAQKTCYLASGGKDGNILLWNVDEGSFLKQKNHGAPINQVLFSKVNYWIAAATDSGILIWNLVKDEIIANLTIHRGDEDKEVDSDDKKEDEKKKVAEKRVIPCLSIAWSKNGTYLYSGWADNVIRVYEVANK